MADTIKYPGTGTDEKKERIAKITSLLEQYETSLANNRSTDIKPYVIFEALEEKVVKVMDIDDVLEVTITEVSCSWADSKPTGDGNLSLDPSDFKKEGKEDDLNT
jgi:hypothetical protein